MSKSPMDILRKNAEASFKCWAEDVVLNGKTVKGIPSVELMESLAGGEIVTDRCTLLLRNEDAEGIQRGQSVEIRNRTYQIDRPLPGEDDFDVVTRVLLR